MALYLRDEEQSQRHGDGQVGVGEKQQQHPVRVKLGDQGESVNRPELKQAREERGRSRGEINLG